MIKYSAVHIPDPCHKIDFDALPYHSDFRDCELCHKKVYDLRHKDEAYFNKLWKETNGDFCGVFMPSQFDAQQGKTTLSSKFKNRVLTLLLGIWAFMGKAQETKTSKPDIELTPMDVMAKNAKNNLEIISEKVGKIDTYAVDVYINRVFYNTYYVADHTFIQLPDHVKEGDHITLKRKSEKVDNGREKAVIKVKKIKFSYGSHTPIVVRVTKKRRLTLLPHKQRPITGAPRFRNTGYSPWH